MTAAAIAAPWPVFVILAVTVVATIAWAAVRGWWL